MAAQPTSTRFLFDRHFETVGGPPQVVCDDRRSEPLPEPEPTFGPADLARARAEGLAEGEARARRELERQAAGSLQAAVDALAAGLARLLADADAARDDAARDAVLVSRAVVRRLLPEVYRRCAAEEIEHVVERVVAGLEGTPVVTVRLAPALSGELTETLGAALARRGFEGRLRILADDTLAVGDCSIEWPGGGADRDAARFWGEVDALIDRATAAPGAASATDGGHHG